MVETKTYLRTGKAFGKNGCHITLPKKLVNKKLIVIEK